MTLRARHTHSRSAVLLLSFLLLTGFLNVSARAETPVGQNGFYVDAAVDNSGNIHLAYWTNDWGEVYYTKYSGSWSAPTYLPASAPTWKPFTYADIAVGPSGIPRVIYGTQTGEQWPNDLNPVLLATANNPNGTSWSVQTVIGTTNRPTNYRIAIDENDQPHIAYQLCAKSEPFWWMIVYRRPDGSEEEIAYGNEGDKVLTPAIEYRNGIVHFAYYRKGPFNTNIWHAWGPPSGPFSYQQISYLPDFMYAETPDMAFDPNGNLHFAYLVANWLPGSDEGHFVGIHVDGQLVEGNWARVMEPEDFGLCSIAYDGGGNRFLSWQYADKGRAYVKVNDDAVQELSPYGHITLAGSNSVYYVRAGGRPGPLYFDELAGGAPPNQSPVALFSVSPATGDFETEYTFDASASNDPDNNLPLTYRWDFNDDGAFDVVNVGNAYASHAFGYPGTYEVNLQVEDTAGGRGNTSHDVVVVNHPPVAAFQASIVGPDSVVFDASLSYDPEDTTRLAYRWDWESDGEWDTRWLVQDQYALSFPGEGIYGVTLVVRDMLWAEDDTTVVVELTAPAPATNLHATITPPDSVWFVDLGWTVSTSEDVLAQKVERSAEAGPWETLMSLDAEAAAFQDTLTATGTYAYRIATTDGFYTAYSESATVIAEPVSVSGLPVIPTALTLTGLVPNPARGAFTIRFGVPGAGTAQIALYDASGRRTVEDTIHCDHAGWFTARIDLASHSDRVAPGVYVAKVSFGSSTLSRPLVVVH